MTICEYRFEHVHIRGSDGYLDRFAARLDELFESRWKVLETKLDEAAHGWWTICLYRDASRSESEERLLR